MDKNEMDRTVVFSNPLWKERENLSERRARPLWKEGRPTTRHRVHERGGKQMDETWNMETWTMGHTQKWNTWSRREGVERLPMTE